MKGRAWGPLAGLPIKLAVFVPLGILDLSFIVKNPLYAANGDENENHHASNNKFVSLSASVAAAAMALQLLLVAVVIFFPAAANNKPNAASSAASRFGAAWASSSSSPRASALLPRPSSVLKRLVHPYVAEVTLACTIAAYEVAFTWLAIQSFKSGVGGGASGAGGGKSWFATSGGDGDGGDGGGDGGRVSSSSFASSSSSKQQRAVVPFLLPMMNWVGVGFLGPIFSCEIFSFTVGVTPDDSLLGGFGPTAGLHAVLRCVTAVWLVTAVGESAGEEAGAGEREQHLVAVSLAAVAAMAAFKSCVAAFVAAGTWRARCAQHADQSTMKGFLAYLSHECRVPLQVVTAGLDVLQNRGGGPSVEEPVTQETYGGGAGGEGEGGMMTRSAMKRRTSMMEQPHVVEQPHRGSCTDLLNINDNGGDDVATPQDIANSLGGEAMYSNHVRAIQMAANSIHAVLNDTLDLHKYTLTGQISMSPRPFDFLRAVEETVEEARAAEFGGRGGGGGGDAVSLRCDVDPAAAAELRWLHQEMGARELGDEQRLRQVLMNLMSNACRHTPAGGSVVVTVTRVQTTVNNSRSNGNGSGSASPTSTSGSGDSNSSPNAKSSSGFGGFGAFSGFGGSDDGAEENVGLVRLEVTVTDTGCGIKERDQKALFTPYGSKGGASASSASGIGLALSQLIAGQHGGKIKASSDVDVGSTFSLEVSLPLVRDNNFRSCSDGSGEGSGSGDEISGGPSGTAADGAGAAGGNGKRPLQQHNVAHSSGLMYRSTSRTLSSPSRISSPLIRRRTSANSHHIDGLNGGGGGGGGGEGVAYEKDYRQLESDMAAGAQYCTDGADRFARTSMKRSSWEGKRALINPFKNIMGYPPSSSGGGRDGVNGGVNVRPRRITEEYARCSAVEYANSNPAAAAAALRPFAQQHRQPRVLLVDDDRLVRMVLGALLRRLGAVCETACHGIDAIEKVRSSAPIPGSPDGAPFDLVIMDLRMPQMNGVEATRILRAGGCAMPIVGLTANTLPEDTACFLKSGATEVLYKPMSAESAGMLLRRYSPAAVLGGGHGGGGGANDAFLQPRVGSNSGIRQHGLYASAGGVPA